jgi:hypothetical protein
MKRYLLGLIGLALLGGVPLRAGECGCDGKQSCDPSSHCCPQCGCCMVPVCHTFTTAKKTTVYKLSCSCETVCIPGVSPPCRRCECCDGSAKGGDSCQEECGCCRVREIHKLVKCPVTKEECVKKCTVEWTCPKCGKCGACETTSAPAGASPATPAPTAAPLRIVPKTTSLAPLPAQLGSR